MLEGQAATIYDVDGESISQATGSAVPTSALFMGGTDGTNVRALTTDTVGRQVMVGAAAAGAAAAGAPVSVSGVDGGGDVRSLSTDTAGRQVMVGAAAAGAAVAGNPVLIAGSDGANAQSLAVDTSGRPTVVGAAANGAAVAGNPVLIAGSDGTNARALSTDATGRLNVATTETKAGSSAVAQVASAVVNTTLLAANANRLGATIYNDSNKAVYVKLGGTASATSFTVKVPARGYFEVPFSYTGIIDGIWEAANGNALVTELTA